VAGTRRAACGDVQHRHGQRAGERGDAAQRRQRKPELETALTNLTNTLNRAGMEFMVSPTGQRLYSELQGVRERIRKGGPEAAAYEELLSILQRLNAELAKAAEKMKGEGGARAKRIYTGRGRQARFINTKAPLLRLSCNWVA
jgi:hypothetical protein